MALGINDRPLFKIYRDDIPSEGLHIAFCANDKETVEKFYQTALDLGAIDNGKPGYRKYFNNYYAGFIKDLNGHNIEILYWKNDLS